MKLYLLAIGAPLSLAVADEIGLSQKAKGNLMDDTRKESRQYMCVDVNSEDGRGYTYTIIDEKNARAIEGPHFKVIVNH